MISLAAAGIFATALGAAESAPVYSWWEAGSGDVFPEVADFPDRHGTLRVVVEGGPVETKGHPFFEPIGPNGRACVTCHQPGDAMSLKPETARQVWEETKGKDPLFAAYDGSNCPTMPQGKRASHSLLLDHGLIRIQRAWPPRDLKGEPIATDFTIEVVRDPWGCNTGDIYGLTAKEPSVSVYRRPRPVANMKYITAAGFPYDPKSGLPMDLDPETGKQMSGNMMSDRRVQTLRWQARDAGGTHLGMLRDLTADELDQLEAFETSVFVAQQADRKGGALDEGGAEGGPALLRDSEAGLLGLFATPVWSEFTAWENMSESQKSRISSDELAFRQSVARGARLFRERLFLVSDSAGINQPLGFGNPYVNACVNCHNMSRSGIDVAPGQIDLGTTNKPFANPQPHLPLFRIRCTGKPHRTYGREILTTDPGYALTSGKCADVGKITTQQLRAMAGREPLFSNGSAKDIPALVDFYDRRYNIGYTEQERQDMINLLKAL